MNELWPAVFFLAPQLLGLPGGDSENIKQAQQKVATVLTFFEKLLDERPYFASQNLTLAEVTAGTVIPWLPRGGMSLSDYPKLSAWCDRLMAREAWQATEATPEAIEALKSVMASGLVH
ncbi:glutathione S-transferase family protein [Microcoleus sp. FACHB-53]|nr:glutathione S-transferase family protein [Microcoleus sp. FACHB-53]MBD2130614.1 glutathione S-transferase family protein [Microcoleus sp. FACHB-1]